MATTKKTGNDLEEKIKKLQKRMKRYELQKQIRDLRDQQKKLQGEK